MGRLIIAFLTLLSVTFSAVAIAPQPTVLAINPIPICETTAKGTDVCKAVDDGNGRENPVINVIGVAINIISFIAGAMAIIVIIISGIKLMTSQGDTQGVAAARSAIIYALIALAVIVLAQVIVGFIINAVG